MILETRIRSHGTRGARLEGSRSTRNRKEFTPDLELEGEGAVPRREARAASGSCSSSWCTGVRRPTRSADPKRRLAQLPQRFIAREAAYLLRLSRPRIAVEMGEWRASKQVVGFGIGFAGFVPVRGVDGFCFAKGPSELLALPIVRAWNYCVRRAS